MKESAFSKQIRDDIRFLLGEKPHHVQLLVDAPRSGKKPYDAYFLCGNRFTAMEYKVVRGASLHSECLRYHQKISLEEVVSAGGRGEIVLYLERLKLACIVPVVNWENLFHINANDNLRIKIDELIEQKTVTIIHRKKFDKTRWDLNIWLA
jgi:hypothetical protein